MLVLVITAMTMSCAQAGFDSTGGNCNQNPTRAREWPSPDGKTKAVENRFVCPGWYSLTVDILAADNQAKTTAFTARPVAQTRPPVWPELKVDWKSDRELRITYPAGQDTTCISDAAGLQVHCIDGTVAR